VLKNQSLSLSSVIKRRPEVIEADINGEIVAMNIETGNCYALNSVGSQIWNFLDDPVQISGVCSRLNDEYDVEPEVCERQVVELLEELHAEELIEVLEDI